MIVTEVIAPTPEAERELWRFVLDIDWVASIEYDYLPPDSALILLLAHPRYLKQTLSDAVWVRLVDVGEALVSTRPGRGPPVVLEIEDAFCPWNAGRWHVEAGKVERTDDEADLRLDVSALGSVYLGGFTFGDLVRAIAATSCVRARRSAPTGSFGSRPALVPRDLLTVPALVEIPAHGRTYAASRRIRLSDMDVRGRLRLDAVARFLQDAAIDDVQETGWGSPEHLWFVRWLRIEIEVPFLDDREVEIVTWCSGLAAIAAGRRWSLRGDRGGRIEVDSVWIHLGPDARPARLENFAVYAESAGTAACRRSSTSPSRRLRPSGWPGRFARPTSTCTAMSTTPFTGRPSSSGCSSAASTCAGR